MPAPSPPPGTDAFNAELAKALRALPPADTSLTRKLGFAVTRCINHVRGFWKPAKALHYPRAAPPTPAGSPRPPALVVTTATHRPASCDSPLSAASSGPPATPPAVPAAPVRCALAVPSVLGVDTPTDTDTDKDNGCGFVCAEEPGDADSLLAVRSPWLGASASFESDFSDADSGPDVPPCAREPDVDAANARLAEFLHALWKMRHGGEGVAQDDRRALGTIVEEESVESA